MKLIEYNDREQQASLLASAVAGQLSDSLASGNRAGLAVPGGTTPAPFLQALAAKDLDWQHVHITLSDERQVNADHERSNAKLLKDNFLDCGAAAQFQPLFEGDASDESMQRITERLNGGCLPLDVCVLGMGADGHFASLFPEADQLQQGLDLDNSAVVMAITADNIPEPRVSLTLSAIVSAAHIHLLITGAEKHQVLTQAQQNERTKESAVELPIQALLRHASNKLTVHYTS